MEKTIKISKKTHKELTKVGNKSETYDEIILRLIAFWQNNNKKN